MLTGRNFSVLGERVKNENNNNSNNKEKKHVYLESALFHQSSKNQIVPILPGRKQAFEKGDYGIVYDNLKPMFLLCRTVGILPISYIRRTTFKATNTWLIYSVVLFLLMISYIAYIKTDKVEIVNMSEGRFEEAVIDYLFTIYLIPIVICPLSWYESRSMNKVFNDWIVFEKIYKKVTGHVLLLKLGNKAILLVIAIPILSFGTMIVTHITMANFFILRVSSSANKKRKI